MCTTCRDVMENLKSELIQNLAYSLNVIASFQLKSLGSVNRSASTRLHTTTFPT